MACKYIYNNIEYTKEELVSHLSVWGVEPINKKLTKIGLDETSKVVDSNNEAMVVYHGTPYDFTEFETIPMGGFFFSTDESLAQQYSTKRGAKTGNILPVFLSLKDITSVDMGGRDVRGYEFIDIMSKIRANSKASDSKVGGLLKNFIDPPLPDGTFKKIFNPTKPTDVYVVFSPNQIKLADGTNTIFDPNTNDIRYQVIGETGTERGSIGVNKQQLISLLGATMYNKPLAQVAVKELLQNSFDAVKARQNLTGNKNPGKIEISINKDDRTISIKDDGIGMTSDIVKNAFLSIGGTNKEGLSAGERSGGLGLAKVQFLMGSQSVKVVTIRDGIKTSIDATNTQLFNDDFDIRTEKTNESNGSFVEVTIPESYTTSDGTQKNISFPGEYSGWREYDILERPLIGNADVSVNFTKWGSSKTETIPIGINSNEQTVPPLFTKVKFNWGEADVYMSVNKKDYPRHQVLSSGIYQFEPRFDLKSGGRIPYDIVVDIKPSVSSTSDQYPFNNQREGFKNTIRTDIDALKSYLNKFAMGEAEKEAVNVFSDIKALPKVDSDRILSHEEVLKLYAELNKIIGENKQIKTEQDVARDVYINSEGQVRNTKTNEILASEKEYNQSFDAQREIEEVAPVDTGSFNPKFPQFHNNTNVDYLKFPGAVEFFTDFGNTVLQLVRFAGDNFGYEYHKLRSDATEKFFSGVSIDRTYGGVHIRKIINAIFVNPLSFDPQNLEEAVGIALHVTLHEINHTTASGEGATFTTDLAKLYGKIYSTGSYGLYEGLFRSVYKKHFETFQTLKYEYDKSTTRNLSKSFEGDSIQESDKGNIQGDEKNVRSGQAAEGRDSGDRKNTETDKLGDVIYSKLREFGSQPPQILSSRNEQREKNNQNRLQEASNNLQRAWEDFSSMGFAEIPDERAKKYRNLIAAAIDYAISYGITKAEDIRAFVSQKVQNMPRGFKRADVINTIVDRAQAGVRAYNRSLTDELGLTEFMAESGLTLDTADSVIEEMFVNEKNPTRAGKIRKFLSYIRFQAEEYEISTQATETESMKDFNDSFEEALELHHMPSYRAGFYDQSGRLEKENPVTGQAALKASVPSAIEYSFTFLNNWYWEYKKHGNSDTDFVRKVVDFLRESDNNISNSTLRRALLDFVDHLRRIKNPSTKEVIYTNLREMVVKESGYAEEGSALSTAFAARQKDRVPSSQLDLEEQVEKAKEFEDELARHELSEEENDPDNHEHVKASAEVIKGNVGARRTGRPTESTVKRAKAVNARIDGKEISDMVDRINRALKDCR